MTIAACTLIATTFTGSGGAVSEHLSNEGATNGSSIERTGTVLHRLVAPLSVLAQVDAKRGPSHRLDAVLLVQRRSEIPATRRLAGVTRCTYEQHRFLMRAVRFYSWRVRVRENKMGQASTTGARTKSARGVSVQAKSCPRFLAKHLRAKASALRARYDEWRTLRDFRVREGSRAWLRAVLQAQKVYPGTEGWLLRCSASEGGHGRWVLNSMGCGGWLQFMSGTFWRMFGAARDDARRKGFRVPASAASWYSPLGQALAGAWAATHGRTHEWFGSGC